MVQYLQFRYLMYLKWPLILVNVTYFCSRLFLSPRTCCGPAWQGQHHPVVRCQGAEATQRWRGNSADLNQPKWPFKHEKNSLWRFKYLWFFHHTGGMRGWDDSWIFLGWVSQEPKKGNPWTLGGNEPILSKPICILQDGWLGFWSLRWKRLDL